MLDIHYSSKFKRDFKVCVKRKYDMSLLQQVIDILRIPDVLPNKSSDHKLTGNHASYRECHKEQDRLLIYRQTDTELMLYRTGTHADLFGM